jgi:ribosomal protein S18 acetylase RimI-like enzyme
MEIDVRTGARSDIDSLEPLWKAMVEHHREIAGERLPIRPAEQAWDLRRQQYRKWLDEGSGLLFLARPAGSDEEPIGYALCLLHPSGPTFDLGTVRGEIDSLVVAKTARGAGIGSALLEYCRRELRRRGVVYWSIGVVEGNVGAERLYERLGFRPWSRTLVARVDGQA